MGGFTRVGVKVNWRLLVSIGKLEGKLRVYMVRNDIVRRRHMYHSRRGDDLVFHVTTDDPGLSTLARKHAADRRYFW